MMKEINNWVWGAPSLVLILSVGLYLTFTTRLAQVRFFPRSIKSLLIQLRSKHTEQGSTSPYQALCTALAATVGTGNLAGVAGALALGGPGVLFWMWVCGILGMVIKYAEATLAVHFSKKKGSNEVVGGPMYIIEKGLNHRWHWLAVIYAFFGVVASFGVGNTTQINTVVSSIKSVIVSYGGDNSIGYNIVIGIVLACFVGAALAGGACRIGKITEQLVPLASLFYLVLCTFVLTLRIDKIGSAFYAIIAGAFSPKAITGGVICSVFQVLRIGISRGVFTNEAGLGTAAIAHAAAKVKHPVEQGFMGILEVFIDTIVICTMTAFVIMCSGVSIPYGTDPGISLTNDAFAFVCGQWINIPISIALCLFAIATILGWGYYGGRCVAFLFGEKIQKLYVVCQTITVVIGACLCSETVWLFAEIVNGLMVIPNLIALAGVSPELIRLTHEYTSLIKNKSILHKKV